MDEYISKEELRKHLKECYDDELFDADMKKAVIGIDIYVENMPSANVQPVKHGRWIKHRIDDPKSMLYGAVKDTTCSVCGKSTPYNTEYCMHCGARMDGDSK